MNALTQVAPTLAQAGPAGGMYQVIFLVGIFVLMYFLLIRPQTKQAKEHRSMIGALKKDDLIVIQGGLIGTIYSVADKEIIVEIANGVKVRVVKQAVQGRWATLPEATKKESK